MHIYYFIALTFMNMLLRYKEKCINKHVVFKVAILKCIQCRLSFTYYRRRLFPYKSFCILCLGIGNAMFPWICNCKSCMTSHKRYNGWELLQKLVVYFQRDYTRKNVFHIKKTNQAIPIRSIIYMWYYINNIILTRITQSTQE